MRPAHALTAVVLLASLPALSYQAPVVLFEMKDPSITESSGVAASGLSDDLLFTHNDSGDAARIYALGPAGDTAAVVTLSGVPVATDWEDMSRGPGLNGQPALFVGDIGDNGRNRAFITVHEVPEPLIDPQGDRVAMSVAPSRSTMLIYEDGPHDAETLLIHPITGEPAIVTKEANGRSGIYVPDPALVNGLPRILRRVATVDFGSIRQVPLPGAIFATGGDISPDGTRLVVRTYWEAFEWPLGAGGFAEAVQQEPLVIRLATARQGEAICYTRDGTGLLDTSEGTRAPVNLYAA